MSLNGISDKDINEKAFSQGVSPHDIEKDYINGWLLHGVFTQSDLASELVLKGGNALRKGYYSDFRFSKDLDFSLRSEMDQDVFKRKYTEVLKYVADRTGVQFDLDKTVVKPKNLPHIDFNCFEADAYFKGFHNEEKITLKAQLDLTEFDKIFLPVQDRQLIHDFDDREICSAIIKCQKAEEIIASKLNTLLHRRKAVDLFDLIHSTLISNPYDLKRLEVVTTFIKKYAYENQPSFVKRQLLSTPLNEHKRLWDSFSVPNKVKIDFELIEQSYESLITSLFGLLPPVTLRPSLQISRVGSGTGDYFNVDFRQKIINAGQSLTLVEMVYDGYRRLIEPYAFEYKRRQSDGRASEYFWGFDQTGGKSRKQSIKQFFCSKIELVNNTETSYNPQWVVEF
jgi:predicted nucleotidyltransferase component of viral defense system